MFINGILSPLRPLPVMYAVSALTGTLEAARTVLEIQLAHIQRVLSQPDRKPRKDPALTASAAGVDLRASSAAADSISKRLRLSSDLNATSSSRPPASVANVDVGPDGASFSGPQQSGEHELEFEVDVVQMCLDEVADVAGACAGQWPILASSLWRTVVAFNRH